MIEQEIKKVILLKLKNFPVVVIFGIRQTGKQLWRKRCHRSISRTPNTIASGNMYSTNLSDFLALLKNVSDFFNDIKLHYPILVLLVSI